MIPLTSTQNKPIEFIPAEGKTSEKIKSSSPKIGWLHTLSDQPGAKFDITIKDALGRVKVKKTGCGNETNKYGELVNIPTMIGEDLEIEIDNLTGAKKIQVFLN